MLTVKQFLIIKASIYVNIYQSLNILEQPENPAGQGVLATFPFQPSQLGKGCW